MSVERHSNGKLWYVMPLSREEGVNEVRYMAHHAICMACVCVCDLRYSLPASTWHRGYPLTTVCVCVCVCVGQGVGGCCSSCISHFLLERCLWVSKNHSFPCTPSPAAEIIGEKIPLCVFVRASVRACVCVCVMCRLHTLYACSSPADKSQPCVFVW